MSEAVDPPRPSFKSKTNPGPATDRRVCAIHRTGRDEREPSTERITPKLPPPAAAAAAAHPRRRWVLPPSRRSATLTSVAGVLRARKTSRFLYLREAKAATGRHARAIEKSPCDLTRPGRADRRFSREILYVSRYFSRAPRQFYHHPLTRQRVSPRLRARFPAGTSVLRAKISKRDIHEFYPADLESKFQLYF